MGLATAFAESLTTMPLTVGELDERREAGKLRENLTTTLEGEIVERQTAKSAPKPVQRREPATWD
jgi:hypothetical protein